MNAIHILWTKPFFEGGGQKFSMRDFDIFTAVISALKWREHNGSITMVTDTAGSEFLKSLGIDAFWNDIDVSLDGINVNSSMFWAAGKLYALAKQKCPCVMIDTDFIVWHGIEFSAIKQDIGVIHTEELYSDVYPPREHFKMKNGYSFDNEFDWSQKPCNTAFLYINDDAFLKQYTDEAIRFMENAEDCSDNLTYMVFAEQRMLSMCAKKANKEVFAFSNLERLFRDGENYFTHTWGFKRQMIENPHIRYDFCMRCANRIKRDYPDAVKILSNIDELKIYF